MTFLPYLVCPPDHVGTGSRGYLGEFGDGRLQLGRIQPGKRRQVGAVAGQGSFGEDHQVVIGAGFDHSRDLAQVAGDVPGDLSFPPVAATAHPTGPDHHRTVDEAGQQVEDVLWRHVAAVRADLLGCLQRAALRVYGEAPQDKAFRLGQQLPAPVDHRAQGPLPCRGAAVSRGEQPEPVVEPFGQVVDVQCAQAGGRQLQGQRDAVQPAADRRDRSGVGVVDHEPRNGGRRACLEQPDGAEPAEGRRPGVGRGEGRLQRRSPGPSASCRHRLGR
ncbi:hypothetical protein Aros01_02314 [Streptosporangium roseum]